MPELYDWAHDDEGSIVLIRYGTPPEGCCRRPGTIRPVTGAAYKQRRTELDAERERQKERSLANHKKRETERAQNTTPLPIVPQRRALQLDDKLEGKGHGYGADQD
jgi:hypothetical protein